MLETDPRSTQILVKVRAVSVNPIDEKVSLTATMARCSSLGAHTSTHTRYPQYASGAWGEEGKIVGCDAAGDVVRVGSAVKDVKIGDR